MANETHKPVLNCNEYNAFWVSWADNTIQVGRGYIYGEKLLASAKDNNPRLITALGFSTGYQNAGQWKFDEDLGMLPVIYLFK